MPRAPDQIVWLNMFLIDTNGSPTIIRVYQGLQDLGMILEADYPADPTTATVAQRRALANIQYWSAYPNSFGTLSKGAMDGFPPAPEDPVVDTDAAGQRWIFRAYQALPPFGGSPNWNLIANELEGDPVGNVKGTRAGGKPAASSKK